MGRPKKYTEEELKERKHARWRKYYYANHEKEKARRRKYYYTHTEIERAKEKRRRNSKKGRYKTYEWGAKRRKINFNLSFEEFLEFWQKPCHYCGENIDTIGLDRIHNDIGYDLSNIISCCAVCNQMKRSYSYRKFLDSCLKIAKNHPHAMS